MQPKPEVKRPEIPRMTVSTVAKAERSKLISRRIQAMGTNDAHIHRSLDMGQKQWWRYKNSGADPSVHKAIMISRALNCSVEDIFGPEVVQKKGRKTNRERKLAAQREQTQQEK